MFQDALLEIPTDVFIDFENMRCRKAPEISSDSLNTSIYARYCGKGLPIVVTGVHMQGSWEPTDFARKFPGAVEIVDCQTEEKAKTTVEEFFSDFGLRDDRDVIYKLKVTIDISFCQCQPLKVDQDWPTQERLKAKCPQLYEAFIKCLPLPELMHDRGALSLSAHFPENGIVPDLGELQNIITLTT